MIDRFGNPHFGQAPDQFLWPHSVAVDSHGDVYIAEVSFVEWGRHQDPPVDNPGHPSANGAERTEQNSIARQLVYPVNQRFCDQRNKSFDFAPQRINFGIADLPVQLRQNGLVYNPFPRNAALT